MMNKAMTFHEMIERIEDLERRVKVKESALNALTKELMKECEDKKFILSDYNNTVLIPENLRNVFFTLLHEHYESELHKLEQEFEEL